MAALAGDTARMAVLIREDPERGWAALMTCASSGHIRACEFLLGLTLRPRSVDFALNAAAAAGHIELCKMLIERGADAAADSSRALSSAGWKGRLDVCRLLIESGANPDDIREDHFKILAIMTASDVDLARMLMPRRDDAYILAAARNAGAHELAEGIAAHMARDCAGVRLRSRRSRMGAL